MAGRIAREKKTLSKMIRLYCKNKHNDRGTLCPECSELLQYASARLDRCIFGEEKPTCGKCKVHCYKSAMRGKIVDVMRYAGPRMILHHPVDAIWHIIDGFKGV